MEATAKLFQNGRSQALRLAKAFRFNAKEVKIRKEGDKVILEPIERDQWPEGFWEDFVSDTEVASDMVKDYLLIRGQDADEPRLQRSVEAFRKNRILPLSR